LHDGRRCCVILDVPSKRLNEWDAMKANQFNVHFELQFYVDYTSSYVQAHARLASGSGRALDQLR
jgi:hypothetical protein